MDQVAQVKDMAVAATGATAATAAVEVVVGEMAITMAGDPVVALDIQAMQVIMMGNYRALSTLIENKTIISMFVSYSHSSKYVAINRGSIHIAPLVGHTQSVKSQNYQPAPGTTW